MSDSSSAPQGAPTGIPVGESAVIDFVHPGRPDPLAPPQISGWEDADCPAQDAQAAQDAVDPTVGIGLSMAQFEPVLHALQTSWGYPCTDLRPGLAELDLQGLADVPCYFIVDSELLRHFGLQARRLPTGFVRIMHATPDDSPLIARADAPGMPFFPAVIPRPRITIRRQRHLLRRLRKAASGRAA